jgi:hypothetical protein
MLRSSYLLVSLCLFAPIPASSSNRGNLKKPYLRWVDYTILCRVHKPLDSGWDGVSLAARLLMPDTCCLVVVCLKHSKYCSLPISIATTVIPAMLDVEKLRRLLRRSVVLCDEQRCLLWFEMGMGFAWRR